MAEFDDSVGSETYNLSADFNSIPIPDLDFLSSDLPFDDNDFGITFDDIGSPFGTDDFLLFNGSPDPACDVSGSDIDRVSNLALEADAFLIPDGSGSRSRSGNSSSESVCAGPGNDVVRTSNFQSPEVLDDPSTDFNGICNNCNQVPILDDRCPDGAGDSNNAYSGSSENSVDSNFKMQNSPVSFLGSGNCDLGVSEANYDNLGTSSTNYIPDSKVKLEKSGKVCLSKRKKEHENGNGNSESRSSKVPRSISSENGNVEQNSNSGNEGDDKRKARLMRNRESAQLSRQRKKNYVEELEDKVRTMHSTIADLNGKISYIIAENATLRQQLGGGMCPPPPGMYPHPPMAPYTYPWIPCAPPYVMKQHGSQVVPLVPIPKLKPQQPLSSSKAKKSETKKTESKTKKVASISFLGLMFFILLFGGLVPMVNFRYGGIQDSLPRGFSSRFNDQRHGRILTVNGHLNGSDSTIEKFGCGKPNTSRVNCEKDLGEGGSPPLSGSDGFVGLGNGSEPLVASLYVPRNDKLVKIDGNLIIHSVLASEKAMAFRAARERKNEKPSSSVSHGSSETGLAIKANMVPALAISADSYKDNLKSTGGDGKLQEWFREGLAGPMLSSGTCSEVFQFDISPSILAAKPVTNISGQGSQNSSSVNKVRNRRILHGLPIPIPLPLPGSTLNMTQESPMGPKDKLHVNSMVVSVLVDPREAGDGDTTEGGGVMGPKSLSRIFVVVLLDSVKYVTYSCVLPLMGSPPHPHLVTA